DSGTAEVRLRSSRRGRRKAGTSDRRWTVLPAIARAASPPLCTARWPYRDRGRSTPRVRRRGTLPARVRVEMADTVSGKRADFGSKLGWQVDAGRPASYDPLSGAVRSRTQAWQMGGAELRLQRLTRSVERRRRR